MADGIFNRASNQLWDAVPTNTPEEIAEYRRAVASQWGQPAQAPSVNLTQHSYVPQQQNPFWNPQGQNYMQPYQGGARMENINPRGYAQAQASMPMDLTRPTAPDPRSAAQERVARSIGAIKDVGSNIQGYAQSAKREFIDAPIQALKPTDYKVPINLAAGAMSPFISAASYGAGAIAPGMTGRQAHEYAKGLWESPESVDPSSAEYQIGKFGGEMGLYGGVSKGAGLFKPWASVGRKAIAGAGIGAGVEETQGRNPVTGALLGAGAELALSPVMAYNQLFKPAARDIYNSAKAVAENTVLSPGTRKFYNNVAQKAATRYSETLLNTLGEAGAANMMDVISIPAKANQAVWGAIGKQTGKIYNTVVRSVESPSGRRTADALNKRVRILTPLDLPKI